jgi:hypothetical protein
MSCNDTGIADCNGVEIYKDENGNQYNDPSCSDGTEYNGPNPPCGGSGSTQNNNGFLSGLAGIFGSIGASVASGIAASNPVSTIKTGTLTATGIPANAVGSLLGGSTLSTAGILPILLIGVVLFLVLGRKKEG